MALQTSGAIALDDIAAEFGGTLPYSLRNYYRGGSFVPDTPTNAGVPTAGTIALTDFYGAAAFDVDISEMGGADYGVTVFTSGFAETATAGVRTISTGQAQTRGPVSPFNYGNLTDSWGRPLTTDIGDDYEVRLEVVSGNSPGVGSAAINTWLAMSSSRTWELSITAEEGSVSGVWRLLIRPTGGSTIASEQFSISATATTL